MGVELHLGCCDLKLSFIFWVEIGRTGNSTVWQVVTFQRNLLKCSKRAIQTELWTRSRFLCFEELCQSYLANLKAVICTAEIAELMCKNSNILVSLHFFPLSLATYLSLFLSYSKKYEIKMISDSVFLDLGGGEDFV